MHGNGQAQCAVFPKHRVLARSAAAGYPVVDNGQTPLVRVSTATSPTGTLYRTSQGPYSMTADTAPLPFTTALLLVRTEAHASVDRRALRNAGISTVRVLTSGLMAARLLAGLIPDDPEPMPQVLLCHSVLADMSGGDFVGLIRSHPQLLDIPIVALASNDDDAHKLSALAVGYSALLVRPYAPPQLRTTLLEAAHNSSDIDHLREAGHALGTGDFDSALAHYTLLTHNQPNPDLAFQEGMRQLQQHQWDLAIRAFQKAMRHISLKGESELGLATAWKGKGDMQRYKHFLSEASHTFARALQWHKARTVYARLLAVDPKAQSPFLSMAERLIREQRFDEAAEALAAGYDMPSASTEQDNTSLALARACLSTEAPAHTANKIEESLKNTVLRDRAPQLGEHIRESLLDATEQQAERQRNMMVQKAQLATVEDELSLPVLPPVLRPSPATKSAAPSAAKSRTNKGIALRDAAPDVDHYNMDKSPAAAGRGSSGNRGQEGPAQVLRPMQPEDAESTLFYNMPGLNEALSVAKFTWKLFRATKHK